MDNYEKLLEEAYKHIKKPEGSEGNGERFEIPKIVGHFEGRKTILTNFFQIASYIRRKPEHFQKFLLKEIAASGQAEGERLVINNKVPSAKINQKIEDYVKLFVLCRECKKPDTELVKDPDKRVTFIHCLACGAKHPVNKI
jgi:translation initiation factor 2 subunit 2